MENKADLIKCYTKEMDNFLTKIIKQKDCNVKFRKDCVICPFSEENSVNDIYCCRKGNAKDFYIDDVKFKEKLIELQKQFRAKFWKEEKPEKSIKIENYMLENIRDFYTEYDKNKICGYNLKTTYLFIQDMSKSKNDCWEQFDLEDQTHLRALISKYYNDLNSYLSEEIQNVKVNLEKIETIVGQKNIVLEKYKDFLGEYDSDDKFVIKLKNGSAILIKGDN